jgi:lipopolysaccharide transport protein LptA
VKFLYAIFIFVLCGLNVRAQTNANSIAGNTNAINEILSLVKTNAPPPKLERTPTQIHSDSAVFDSSGHQVTYFGHVRVDDPQMKLTCVCLIADLLPTIGRVNHVVAKTNVVIDATDEKGQPMHATSDEAIYDYQVKDGVTNETITLTGHAKAENTQIALTGEPIKYDLMTGALTATNETMTLRQNFNGTVANTNSPSATDKSSAPKNSP